MIAKRYQKTTYTYGIVSVFICLLITLIPIFFDKDVPENLWEIFEKTFFAIGYMFLVFVMSFLDNKTNLLGIRGIHFLIYPLFLFALAVDNYSLDQLLVFAALIFILNNYTKMKEKKELYKPLFTTTLLITFAVFYDLKYLCYLIIPISIFRNRYFLNSKHLFAFIAPLILTPFFIVGVLNFYGLEYQISPLNLLPISSFGENIASPFVLFWIGLAVISFLGYFQKTVLVASKMTHAFSFMFYCLLISFVLLFFDTGETSKPLLISIIAPAYFLGHLIDKLKAEWKKDFLLILILVIGIFIKWNHHAIF